LSWQKSGIVPERADPNRTQSPTSKELYRDLFKNISSSYNSGVGNLLLQQPSMPAPSLEANRKMNMEMEIANDCGPRMCLQFVESRLIPFGISRIGDHVWEFLAGSNGHEDFQMVRNSLRLVEKDATHVTCRSVQALQDQGNEMFGHCTVTNPCGSMQTLGNIAVRRYYEANKLTFVWECTGLCSHGGASTMRVHQKGWYVRAHAPTSNGSS
jgi:hypothetical protein